MKDERRGDEVDSIQIASTSRWCSGSLALRLHGGGPPGELARKKGGSHLRGARQGTALSKSHPAAGAEAPATEQAHCKSPGKSQTIEEFIS
jgi:hypothetical protein